MDQIACVFFDCVRRHGRDPWSSLLLPVRHPTWQCVSVRLETALLQLFISSLFYFVPLTMAKLGSFTRLLLLFLGVPSLTAAYKNVKGEVLQKCSGAGMALTGFTRNGQCIDENDDQGSHHVCIDMSSATGGNFCTVTGQPNWCSSKMPCESAPQSQCQVKHWCVCQWAFASYIDRAGGCDKIQRVVCDATNMVALTAYREQSTRSDSMMRAYKCLLNKCKLGEVGAQAEEV